MVNLDLPDTPAAHDVAGIVTCPMCHTPSPLSRSAIAAGGDWQCTRCGQHWDGSRLSTVAAYAAWVVDQKQRSLQRPTETKEAE
jgi:ribosomal protein L37AE/L43A